MHNFVLEKRQCSKPRKKRIVEFESSHSPRQTLVVSSFPEDDTGNGYRKPLALSLDYLFTLVNVIPNTQLTKKN